MPKQQSNKGPEYFWLQAGDIQGFPIGICLILGVLMSITKSFSKLRHCHYVNTASKPPINKTSSKSGFSNTFWGSVNHIVYTENFIHPQRTSDLPNCVLRHCNFLFAPEDLNSSCPYHSRSFNSLNHPWSSPGLEGACLL